MTNVLLNTLILVGGSLVVTLLIITLTLPKNEAKVAVKGALILTVILLLVLCVGGTKIPVPSIALGQAPRVQSQPPSPPPVIEEVVEEVPFVESEEIPSSETEEEVEVSEESADEEPAEELESEDSEEVDESEETDDEDEEVNEYHQRRGRGAHRF